MKFKIVLVVAIYTFFASPLFSQTRKPARLPDGTLVHPGPPPPLHHGKPLHRPHLPTIHFKLPKHPKGGFPPGLKRGRPGPPPAIGGKKPPLPPGLSKNR